MLFLHVIFLLSASALAQDTNCNFFINVNPGSTYLVRNLNYPSSYARNAMCRWIAQSPAGYVSRLDCLLELPQTSGCTGDRVLISKSGDPQLNNADVYCGRQTLTGIVSNSRNISVALIVASNSNGGRFTCNLTAQVAPAAACSCGIRKLNRIVGGTVTGVNEYTMAAAIIDKVENTTFCGGVIINQQYILTAAHCLVSLQPRNLAVSVGNRNYRDGIRIDALRIINHPNFNENTYDLDIAVLQLVSNIPFNDNIGPVCLPFNYQTTNLQGTTLTILGWGTTSFGGPTSVNLQQVNVNVTNQESCRAQRPTLTSRQLCTYTPGKDACQNDSGGPCLAQSAATGRLFSFGIVSYGDGCGTSSTPAVQTRVTELLTWITTNAPGTYCTSN